MRWCLNGNDTFDGSSFYKAIHGTIGIPFLGRVYGALKPQRGFLFFMWMAVWGKILTTDNIIKKGFSFFSWCCLCRRSGETVSHLLLHCDVTYALWCAVFSMFGVQ